MEYDTIFAAARHAGNELALADAGRLGRTVAKAAALLRENTEKCLRPMPSTWRRWMPIRPCATACG